MPEFCKERPFGVKTRSSRAHLNLPGEWSRQTITKTVLVMETPS